MRRSFQSPFLATATAKARSVLLAKQLPLEQSENANRHFLELEQHLTRIKRKINKQLTFLKSNLIQIHCIPAAKNRFTSGVGGMGMKEPKHSVWKRRQQKQGREKEKGAAPPVMLSIASVKAENTAIVFQTQILRTQPYHKAEEQTAQHHGNIHLLNYQPRRLPTRTLETRFTKTVSFTFRQ